MPNGPYSTLSMYVMLGYVCVYMCTALHYIVGMKWKNVWIGSLHWNLATSVDNSMVGEL